MDQRRTQQKFSFRQRLRQSYSAVALAALCAAAAFAQPPHGSLNNSTFIQAGTAAVPRSAEDLARERNSIRNYGVIGSATDSTAFMNAAMHEAEVTGLGIYLPASPYKYHFCNAAYTGAANIRIYGDGAKSSMFDKTAACNNTPVDTLDVFTTGAVVIDGVGSDDQPNAVAWIPLTAYTVGQMVLDLTSPPANPTHWQIVTTAGTSGAAMPAVWNHSGGTTSDGTVTWTDYGTAAVTKSIISILNASGVDVGHSYFAHGQYAGLSVTNSSNVRVHDNVFFQNTGYGYAVGCSLGGTGAPIYNSGFTDIGNVYQDEPIGNGYTAFCTGLTINDSYINSSLELIQMPNANADVTVSVDGSAIYGCTVSCGIPVGDGVHIEGSSNIRITGHIYEPLTNGIFAIGSNLTIAPGGKIDLPVNRLSISMAFDQIGGGYPILLAPTSNGITPTHGVDNKISGSLITNSAYCGAWDDQADVTDNTCDNVLFTGWNAALALNSHFDRNRVRNAGQFASGTYPGLLINNGTSNLTVNGNSFSNDTGVLMYYCVEDDTLAAGTATHVTSRNNECQGANAGPWYPAPAIPTITTGAPWNAGDTIQTFVRLAGQPTTLIATAGGSPGSWVPGDNLPDSGGRYYASYPAAPSTATPTAQYIWGADSGGAFWLATDPSTASYTHARILANNLSVYCGATAATDCLEVDAGGNATVAGLASGGTQCLEATSAGKLQGTGSTCAGAAAITALTGGGTATGPGSSALTLALTAGAGIGISGTYNEIVTNTAVPLSGTSSAIGGALLAAGACASTTVAVTGATTAMAVEATPATYPGAAIYWHGYVSSANTVTVDACAAIAATPASSAYNVRVLQ